MTKKQKQLAQEIFDTVYSWGRVNMVTDSKSEYYQKLVKQLIRSKSTIKDGDNK